MAVGRGWSAGAPDPDACAATPPRTPGATGPTLPATRSRSTPYPARRAPFVTSIDVGTTTYLKAKVYGTWEEDGCPDYRYTVYQPVAQLLVVDRFTLAPVRDRTYAVNSLCSINALANALDDVKSDQLVFLSDTDGLPTRSPFSSDQELRVARARLGDARPAPSAGFATRSRTSATPLARIGRAVFTGGPPGPENRARRSRRAGCSPTARRRADRRTLGRDQTNGYTVDTASFATGPQAR